MTDIEIPGNHWTVPHLTRGARIAWDRGRGDGIIFTDTIESVWVTEGDWIPAPEQPWWKQALRAVTPRRWRKPLPQGTRGATKVIVSTEHDPDTITRAHRAITGIVDAISPLADGPPYVIGKDIMLGEREDLTDPKNWE